MKRESFFRHFAAHPLVYLVLAGLCLLVGITAFQLTEPRSDEAQVLLIDAGGTIPDIPHHVRVEYPAPDADPQIVQAYVLTTGGGDFDYYIAPTAILPELYDQQLIRPVDPADAILIHGTIPAGRPLNDDYCLCLAHSADADAAGSFTEMTNEN